MDAQLFISQLGARWAAPKQAGGRVGFADDTTCLSRAWRLPFEYDLTPFLPKDAIQKKTLRRCVN